MNRLVEEPVADPAEQAIGGGPPMNRMGIALLSLGGLLIAVYMLMYKIGVLPTIVCGTGGCETVQLSRYSMFLGVPVPAVGVGGYAALLIVALLGIQPGRERSRGIALTLLALATTAFAFTAYLNILEAFVIEAWCRWCIGSAVMATLIFLLSLLELPRVRRRTV